MHPELSNSKTFGGAMRRNRNLAQLCVLGLLLTASCDDFLSENPTSITTPGNFYRTSEDAVAAVTHAYDGLGGNFTRYYVRFLPFFLLYPTDIADGQGPLRADIANYTYDAEHGWIGDLWAHIYDAVNRANVVIDRVPSIEMDAQLRAQLVAEARFLRALHYFNLVRMWGPVPLEVNETVDLTELEKGRAPTHEVYELIIEDLIAAEPDLPVAHPAADGGRATRGAAKALLAKVYLTLASEQRFDAYPGRTYAEPAESYYQKAADEAQSVIDLGAYALFPDYAHVFREEHENGSEHIFSVNFDRDNLVSEQGFGLFLAPQGVAHTEFPERGTSWMWTSDEFFERFPDGDYRKDVTFVTEAPSLEDGTTVPYTGWQFPHPHIDKYWTRNAFNDNRLVIRYADVLLLRAEALNELQGPNPQAIGLVNEVRARARNGDPSAAPQDYSEADVEGRDGFRELIWEERLWELAFEMHRWFDLSRTNRLVRTVRDAYDGAFPISEKHKLFPIPASQLLVNRELEQNPEW